MNIKTRRHNWLNIAYFLDGNQQQVIDAAEIGFLKIILVFQSLQFILALGVELQRVVLDHVDHLPEILHIGHSDGLPLVLGSQ